MAKKIATREENFGLFTPEEFKANFKVNKKIKRKEEKVQIAFCEFVKSEYPDVIFACDLASGMKLPIWIAAANKKMRSERGHPDFNAAEPRGPFIGFYLEIKSDGVIVWNKDESLRKDKHLEEQNYMLAKLRDRGYYAQFGIGLEDCKNQFKNYMDMERKNYTF